MRRYWINFKGKQEGPLSLDELAKKGVDKSAYVWHSGLDDWVKITKVPELNEMLEGKPVEILSETDAEDQVPNLPQDDIDAPEVPKVPELPNENDVPELPAIDVTNGDLNPRLRPARRRPRPGMMPKDAMSYGAASQLPELPVEKPKCPPTNLVWSIILTVVCCTPLGVVGIIFAILTKRHYNRGNYKKAEKFSEYGAWACIAAIILGIITTPFSWLMQMMLGI